MPRGIAIKSACIHHFFHSIEYDVCVCLCESNLVENNSNEGGNESMRTKPYTDIKISSLSFQW